MATANKRVLTYAILHVTYGVCNMKTEHALRRELFRSSVSAARRFNDKRIACLHIDFIA